MSAANRGEVWLADLGMAAKVRPVLVFNVPFSDLERAIFAVIPHTTALRGGRFEIKVGVHWLKEGAFDAQGLRPVPGTVLIRKLGTLTPAQLEQVASAARIWLGL
jgi:mRNA interferase MazF